MRKDIKRGIIFWKKLIFTIVAPLLLFIFFHDESSNFWEKGKCKNAKDEYDDDINDQVIHIENILSLSTRRNSQQERQCQRQVIFITVLCANGHYCSYFQGNDNNYQHRSNDDKVDFSNDNSNNAKAFNHLKELVGVSLLVIICCYCYIAILLLLF